MGHSWPCFLYFSVFSTVESKGAISILLMTGFEPRTSGVGGNRSTNWATTISFKWFLQINPVGSRFCTEISIDFSVGTKTAAHVCSIYFTFYSYDLILVIGTVSQLRVHGCVGESLCMGNWVGWGLLCWRGDIWVHMGVGVRLHAHHLNDIPLSRLSLSLFVNCVLLIW